MSCYVHRQEEIDAIEAEIAEIDAALSAIRNGGQSYTINSGASSRTVTLADYAALRKDKSELNTRLMELKGQGGIVFNAGW